MQANFSSISLKKSPSLNKSHQLLNSGTFTKKEHGRAVELNFGIRGISVLSLEVCKKNVNFIKEGCIITLEFRLGRFLFTVQTDRVESPESNRGFFFRLHLSRNSTTSELHDFPP